ncbi:TetR/AcrR family transcriptional regulator (plasmid) [Agrobacterium larrymoorei]|uniref:TetR/AcrR family transcriptional regulator n=1 Tax=Agrobacterium larrymoorei TaxID=160699 RepID=A0ABX8TDN9_9HYPH|nr:TetR/AcrR family transcriptional regulator [Agrobacterium larrymoorei]
MADKHQPVRPAIRNAPKQARALARIDHYLKVAEELFGVHGFDAVTMIDIGKKAEISASYIYRYFPDKFAVLAAIQHQHIELKSQLLAEVVSTINCREDALEALARYFDAYHCAVCEIPSALRILTAISAAKSLAEAEIEGNRFHVQILFNATSGYVNASRHSTYESALMVMLAMADATLRLVMTIPIGSQANVRDFKSTVRNQIAFYFDGDWPKWPAFYKATT